VRAAAMLAVVSLLAFGACRTETTELVPAPSTSVGSAPECGPESALCATDHDCTPDPGKACHADGQPCAHAKDCCGAYCVPGAAGALVCSSLCREVGEACVAPADCCAPGLACMHGDAGQQCVAMP
jgi:hypothetical protein